MPFRFNPFLGTLDYYETATAETAASILTKLLTVDGSGSGLDADLLDGQHASAFVSLPIADSSTIIKGSADATKLLRFEVDGFTGGATRVLTPPDADITLAGVNYANVFNTTQTITVTAQASTREKVIYAGASDASRDFWAVANGTTTDGRFAPAFFGAIESASASLALNFTAFTNNSNDTGTAPLMGFLARIYPDASSDPVNANFTDVVTRPLFAWYQGAGTIKMQMQASGNLIIGGSADLTNGGRLQAIGGADKIQLIVKGHTTQAVATPMAQILRNDAAAGVSAMLGLTALGSGANGDGGSISLAGKSSTTAATAMGLIDWRWIDATHASQKAAMRFYAYDTSARLGLEIEASGTEVKTAVNGATAVVRANHIVDADGTLADITTKFNALLVAIENFGVLKTS